ncbi:MAG: threonine synthase [Dehalococcoidia bacterium]|nr:threonine synthase [Dehalococcoidia bacterium]
MGRPSILEKYREFLPITPKTPMITMGEANTPLVRSRRLEKEFGVGELYFKLEGCNPTGSFKDRGMVMAFAKAIEAGATSVICASTGNTSASAAAYGARFSLNPVVVVPQGNIAQGKFAQAMVYGAKILAIGGNFDEALKIVRELSEKHPIALVNSLNPYRIEGQKTAAFEIVDELGDAPDYLFIPVGNAGNITAYWKGFKEYFDKSLSRKKPRMMGFQAEGAAPIVRGEIVKEPKTLASAIRIGNPASWKYAVAARDESGGTIDSVSDDEIMDAYRLLASREGVFGEPASAASMAGVIKMRRKKLDLSSCRVVCVITGNGLKDVDIALRYIQPPTQLPAEYGALEKALGWR